MRKLCLIISLMVLPLYCMAHLGDATSTDTEVVVRHGDNTFYINVIGNNSGNNNGIKYPKAPSKGILVSIDRNILCLYGDFTNKFVKIENINGEIVFLTTVSECNEKIEIPTLPQGEYYMYLYDENVVYGGEFEMSY